MLRCREVKCQPVSEIGKLGPEPRECDSRVMCLSPHPGRWSAPLTRLRKLASARRSGLCSCPCISVDYSVFRFAFPFFTYPCDLEWERTVCEAMCTRKNIPVGRIELSPRPLLRFCSSDSVTVAMDHSWACVHRFLPSKPEICSLPISKPLRPFSTFNLSPLLQHAGTIWSHSTRVITPPQSALF